MYAHITEKTLSGYIWRLDVKTYPVKTASKPRGQEDGITCSNSKQKYSWMVGAWERRLRVRWVSVHHKMFTRILEIDDSVLVGTERSSIGTGISWTWIMCLEIKKCVYEWGYLKIKGKRRVQKTRDIYAEERSLEIKLWKKLEPEQSQIKEDCHQR